MRKYKFILPIFLGFLLAALVEVSQAKAITPIPSSSGIFGQNQYYSVVYDGEGEAAVAAKLMIQNNSKEEATSTIVEIPGTHIRLIRAVQEAYQKEQYCGRWDQVCTQEGNQGCIKYERKCVDWHWRTRTWNPIYYVLTPKAEELSNSVKYTINLAKPLEEEEPGAILLYYKVPQQAKKSWGVFRFKFETAKVPYDVNYVRVAVNVQEGFYLKGGEAETRYRPNNYGKAFTEFAPQAMGVESKALGDFSNRIVYMSGYVKTTSGLDPWESFTVEGQYAKSHFALYRWQIIGSILGTLVFLVGVSGLIWWLIRRSQKRRLSQIHKKTKTNLLPLKILGSGIGSAVTIIILILLSFWFLQWINYHISYRYQGFPSLLVMLISGILVLVTIFGPALYFGIKYGASKGVWTLVATILALIILGGIILLLYVLLFSKPHYPYPIYPKPIYPMRESLPNNVK